MMHWTLSAFSDEAGTTCDAQIQALQTSELRLMDLRNIDGFSIVDLPLDHAHAVKEKLNAVGIGIQMLGSPIGKIDITDDLEIDLIKLQRLGALAPILGCNAIRIFSYYNKHALSHDDWRKTSLERLGRLRDEAREFGLVLYHENERHIFGDLSEDVQRLGDALRDEISFRCIFDFDNYNQSGENVWDAWLRLRDQVDAFHLKDSRNGQHVPAGEGTGSVKEILSDAAVRGWSGPISIEPHLKHSSAVAGTHPSGIENQSFQEMSASESFAVACRAAQQILLQLQS